MANVISGANYAAVATNYANARDKVVSSVDYLFQAVYQIVLLQDIIPEVDLLQEFYSSYLVNNDILKSPVNFLPAVRSINNHVLSRGTDASLDAYLESEGVTIPQTWADLSSAAGFTIASEHISG